MALRINFNYESAVTHTALKQNEAQMNKSLLRLSTGLRILNAADDSAGLFIADQLALVSAGLEQGNRNIQTGISALQIAENSAGQIYNKLKEIYVRAQNAANDINDPNARNALQSEIMSFVDAIQKIGTDTEYNGIKLLDGTFTSKYIHYGPRMGQVVNVSIGSLKAEDLGAYTATGTGGATGQNATSTTSFSSWISGASMANYWVGSGDYFRVSGIDVVGNTGKIVDASVVAYNINNDATLKSQGIEATATNISIAAPFSKVATISLTGTGSASGDSATVTTQLYLNFYVGNNASSAAFSITSDTSSLTHTGTGSSNTSVDVFTNLDDLVTQINTLASNNNTPIVAEKTPDGKLRLRTTNGETIGIEARLDVNITTSGGSATAAATINLDQLLQGASSATTGSLTASTTHYASAVNVGELVIGSPVNFTLNQSGVGALGLTSVNRKNLYSIDVTSNPGAEEAMMIAAKALQRTDSVRSYIGAIMNNLQSIFDAQKVANDNTKEAENVIRNVDFAEEMTRFVTMQIRMQAGTAMLAQSNTLPQLVLQLLR